MGNSVNVFEERKIPNVSEPVNDYINKYILTYGKDTGERYDYLWKLYNPEKFETKTFFKIQQMDLLLQRKILDQSFGYTLSITPDPLTQCEESEKLLDYWCEHGIYDKLIRLYDENKALDYSALYRVPGLDCIEIPYTGDPLMTVRITPRIILKLSMDQNDN